MMLRGVALATVLTCAAGGAWAADPPVSAACMAPIPPGAADPVPRDVHFHVNGSSRLISITLCIASNTALPLQGAAANVGLFSADGVLINYAGQSYSNVQPLTNPGTEGPKLLLMYGVAIEVDPKYGQHFSPDTVVALSTVACTKAAPDCAPAAAQTQTFLLPVQIDDDLPGGKK